MTSLHFKGRVFVENLHLAALYHDFDASGRQGVRMTAQPIYDPQPSNHPRSVR